MTVMYLGPDIKGVIIKNQVFTYDPLDKKEQVKAIYPAAAELFAGMDEIVEKRSELAKPNSYLSLAYKNLEKELKK